MSTRDNSNSASICQTTEYKSRRMFNIAAIFLSLAFLIFLCQLVNFGVFNVNASGLDSLPVSIRAASRADYSRDMHALSIPPISENILRQIILDIPSTGSPQDRIATLQVALSLPVPTMTPDYRLPVTFTPTRTIGPLPSRTPTRTPSHTPSKTANSTRTPTATPTETDTEPNTATVTPPTVKPTATVAPPTNSPATTVVPSTYPPATTVVPPTNPSTATDPPPTDPPTATDPPPTDPPTATDPPPTDPPTATEPLTELPSCALALTSSDITLSGPNLEMTITNNGDILVTITRVYVEWSNEPVSQNLTEVKFRGVTIVENANDPSSPSDYPSEKDWTGTQSDRELAATTSDLLVLLFKNDFQSTNFSITVTFDNVCTLNKSY